MRITQWMTTIAAVLAVAHAPAAGDSWVYVGSDRGMNPVHVGASRTSFASAISDTVTSIAFKADGTHAYVGTFSGRVYDYTVSNGSATLLLNGIGGLPELATSPDGTRLWVADGTTMLREVQLSPFTVTPRTLTMTVDALVASPDGTALYVANGAGQLGRVSTSSFTTAPLPALPSAWRQYLAIDQTGRYLVVASDGAATDTLTRDDLGTLARHQVTLPSSPGGIALEASGLAWLTFPALAQLRFVRYDSSVGLPPVTSSVAVASGPVDVAIASDGRYAYVSHTGGHLTIMDMDSRQTHLFQNIDPDRPTVGQVVETQPDLGSRWSSEAFNDSSGGSARDRALSIRLADVNGDGFADACGRDAAGIVCTTTRDDLGSYGAYMAQFATTWAAGFTSGWSADETRWGTLRFPNLDGDASADVCGRDTTGIVCGRSNGSSSFAIAGAPWSTQFSDANGWNATSRWRTIEFVDLDRDGDQDVCGRDTGGLRCAFSNRTTAFTGTVLLASALPTPGAASWASDESWWGTIRYGDIDGDGDLDVCARKSDGVWCSKNNGAGGFPSAPTLWLASFSDANGWGAVNQAATIQLADVNGDHRADLCGRHASGVQCATANGAGTAFDLGTASSTSASFSNANGWNAEKHFRTIRVVDVNGDGKADICGRGWEGIYCAISASLPTLPWFMPARLWSRQFGEIYGWGGSESYWRTVQPGQFDRRAGLEFCGRGNAGLWCSNR